MTASAIQALVLANLLQWGLSLMAIITSVIGLGVAYLVFRFGWGNIQNSLNEGMNKTADRDYGFLSENDEFWRLSDEEYTKVPNIYRQQRYSKYYEDVDDIPEDIYDRLDRSDYDIGGGWDK